MRKQILTSAKTEPSPNENAWLNLEEIARVEVTSEDPAFPIERALIAGSAGGWRATEPGEQTVRIVFDAPQRLRVIQLLFIEEEVERGQEFVLSWSGKEALPFREIVRQQFHFSPGGAVRELEKYQVDLENARTLELRITPDRSRGPARASLAEFRIA